MVYKLKYPSKKEAIAELQQRGITDAEGNHDQRKCALVFMREVETEAEFNEEGEVITEATFYEHCLVDLLCKESHDFGAFKINPKNEKHEFLH